MAKEQELISLKELAQILRTNTFATRKILAEKKINIINYFFVDKKEFLSKLYKGYNTLKSSDVDLNRYAFLKIEEVSEQLGIKLKYRTKKRLLKEIENRSGLRPIVKSKGNIIYAMEVTNQDV